MSLKLLVIFVTLWINGCTSLSSLWRSPKPSPTVSIPAAAPASPSSAPVAKPTIAGDPFENGVDKAASATTLTQSAQTADDWKLIINQWQQAIAFMKAVPASHSNRAAAQKLIPDYQRSLALAQQRAKGGIPVSASAKPSVGEPVSLIPIPQSSASPTPTPSTPEATNALNAVNRQQIQFFTKQKRFAATLKELELPESGENYQYSIVEVQANYVAAKAIAKKGDRANYTSAVAVTKDEANKDTTQSTVCASKPALGAAPPLPQLVNQKLQCPPNSNP
jgi:hypothetical protein